MSEALTQMIAALDLEIPAIRKKGGGSQIGLRGGERVGQAEGSCLYRFVVAEDLNLRDDAPIRVTAGQEDVPGVLVSFRERVGDRPRVLLRKAYAKDGVSPIQLPASLVGIDKV